MERFSLIVGIILMLAAPAMAADMCAKGEPNDVCALHEQRDYALDQVAHVEGARRDEHEYWRRYIQGLPDVPTTEKHIKAVCAWRAAPNKAVEEMCRWWGGTQPKPLVKGSAR